MPQVFPQGGPSGCTPPFVEIKTKVLRLPTQDPLLHQIATLNLRSTKHCVQCSCSGWPTGYGKKLSSSQEQLGQATCLAVA